MAKGQQYQSSVIGSSAGQKFPMKNNKYLHIMGLEEFAIVCQLLGGRGERENFGVGVLFVYITESSTVNTAALY